jgi:3-hydroxyisobutyrate dehydrogenase-like beta-hydroxyacid dehydrogenase
MNVGVIGLGVMGAPIARNILQQGHTLTVYARRPAVMAPLVELGARAATSPAELAASNDVVVTMVLDTAAVEDVTLGSNGIVHGARPGSIVIDHSTIVPDGARRIARALAARDITMLDAPVSGGAAAAEAGTLSIMVGGDEGALERVRPVLECYGRTIAHIGPTGAGQVAKACNQICTIVNMLGAAEALLLAERCGVDPSAVRDVVLTGFGASRMLEFQGPKMIARAFDGNVESRLHYKDIHIVLDMARRLGLELPASAAAARVWTTLQDRGGAKRDSAAIVDVLANP